MSLYRLERQVERVALQHHLVPLFAWVEEEHPVSFLRDAAQECRGILVLGRDHVLTLEINPYLYPKGRILPLEGRDGSVRVLVFAQAAQLELGPRGLVAASSAGRDGSPSLLLTAVLLLLLHHVAENGEVEWGPVRFGSVVLLP